MDTRQPKTRPSKRPRHGLGPQIERPPRTGTDALRDFLVTFYRIQSLLNFILKLVSFTDQTYDTLTAALIDTTRSEAERRRLEEQRARRTPAIDALKQQRQILMEIVLARHVDNYLAFVASLLAEIFIQRPETMKSAEKVDVEWVLGHQSMDSLVKGLAERRVEALTYQSFGTLREHMQDRFGLSMCTDADAKLIVEAIETRNIIVHNRCVMNRRYVERTGHNPGAVGKVRSVDIRGVEKLTPPLVQSALLLDRAARTHLKLKAHRFDAAKLSAT